MKQLLLLFRRGPHGANLAREGLDTALAASAFEVPTTLAFDGDGVYLLLSDQDAAGIGEKTLGANFAALPMFEIEDLRVHGPSLA
ncbi:MAG TPA: DsrE family protein, partial [Pseudomonadales bacterium]|nr:DsrE family protein [Pseudomonadales bacterium]